MDNTNQPSDIQKEIILYLKPANLLFRSLAFILDAVLIFLLSIAFLKIFLPLFFPATYTDFINILNEIFTSANKNAEMQKELVEKLNALQAQDSAFFYTLSILPYCLGILYFFISEQITRGQSIGKKTFKILVVAFSSTNLQIAPPNKMQSLSRAIWKAALVFPFGIFIFIIALFDIGSCFFSKKRRSFHDKLTQTNVIDLKNIK